MRICPYCQIVTRQYQCPHCDRVTLTEQEAHDKADAHYEAGRYATGDRFWELYRKLRREG